MRINILRILLLSMVVHPITGRAATETFTIWQDKNDGWSVYLYRDENGTFSRCSTVVEYSSGRLLSFSVDYTSHLIMRIGHKTSPVGNLGTNVQNYIGIDNKQPRAAPGIVEKLPNGSIIAKTDFFNDYRLFGNLRKGYVLNLSGDSGNEQLSLKGSAKALQKMAECVPRPFENGIREVRVKNTTGNIIYATLPTSGAPLIGAEENSEVLLKELMGETN